MAGYGMIILGPTLHYWFNFVSKLFPGRDLFSTLKKMVMGQSIYGPAMTAIFFSLNARLQGMSNFRNLLFIPPYPFVHGFPLLTLYYFKLRIAK
jgi:hypothetical protein